MKVEFIREERDCPHNKQIRATSSGQSYGILYDFAVVIDGERRAHWSRTGNTYWLHDEDGNRISANPRDYFGITRATQAEFAGKIEELLQLGCIPTLADYAARKQARENKALVDQRVALETKRRQQREAASAAMLDALEEIAARLGATGGPSTYEIRDALEIARAAITKATEG